MNQEVMCAVSREQDANTHTMSAQKLAQKSVPKRPFELCTLDEIVAVANPMCLPYERGVYFLVDSGTVVYIGRSSNVGARVATHFVAGIMHFDSWTFQPCDREDLDQLEVEYIRKYKPKHNKVRYSESKFVEPLWAA